MDEVNKLRECFYYKDGVLYWSEDRVLRHRPCGYKNKFGYIEVNLTTDGVSKKYLAHRIIFALHHGYLPELVDHIDRDATNNYISNLREADKQINSINRGIPTNNTSGIRGVSWHKAAKKWTAQIKVKGKKIHLGTFKYIKDAKKSREEAEDRWFNI